MCTTNNSSVPYCYFTLNLDTDPKKCLKANK